MFHRIQLILACKILYFSPYFEVYQEKRKKYIVHNIKFHIIKHIEILVVYNPRIFA